MANRINVVSPTQPNLELFFDFTGTSNASFYNQLEVKLGSKTFLGDLTVLTNTGAWVVLRGTVDLSGADEGLYQPSVSPLLEVNLKRKPGPGATVTPLPGENVQPVLILPPISLETSSTSRQSQVATKKPSKATKKAGGSAKAASGKSTGGAQPKGATPKQGSKPAKSAQPKSAAKKTAAVSAKAKTKAAAKVSAVTKPKSAKKVAKKSTSSRKGRVGTGKSTPKSSAKSTRGKKKR